MKAVDVDVKGMEVVDYFTQLDQVKLRLVVYDGKEKASIKQVSVNDIAGLGDAWIREVRARLKEQHRDGKAGDGPLAGHVVIRFKQEEDVLSEKVTRFLMQVRERVRQGKLSKLSYIDLQKCVVGMSVKF